LHLAARDGHSEVVDVLLKKGADINAETKYKFTSLHLAAGNNHLKVLQARLDGRANTNVETEYKFTLCI
jgi:ankyrin repeat protein